METEFPRKKGQELLSSGVRGLFWAAFISILMGLGGSASLPQETVSLRGVDRPVEIVYDRWGIPHIYATTERDLFFAQGFNAARDRLFQLEIWRRRATGTLAEILGRRALRHDIGARLFKSRNDIEKELAHYHPRGKEIVDSFVRGINAYIDLTREKPELLPLEFRLLGIQPGHWTKEVVISRHNGLFRNARDEVTLARLGSLMGFDRLKNLLDLHPGDPELEPSQGLDVAIIPADVLELLQALRSPPEFTSEDIPKNTSLRSNPFLVLRPFSAGTAFNGGEFDWPGSNNWALSGRMTASGFPILANDPHRQQQIPSLRYWVHLVGPGWNVIGGGEPALPGVSIGHNDYGAWGLTIFAIDQEDILVYDLNPENLNQYRYDGQWEEMTILRETIRIKGEEPVPVELKFTRHGPILKEDPQRHKAYALRAAWLEVGCAPYLASLRMDQARNWGKFREACRYSLTPSENMVWADREGNIGWQATGIAPIRKGWTGLLPVPGDGRFEWQGFVPGLELPSLLNPEEGYIATANQDNVPPDYSYALGFMWAEPYRHARLVEVLSAPRKMDLSDMAALQHDVLSIPARELVGLLKGLTSPAPGVNEALALLRDWDFRLESDSPAAALFVAWQRRLSEAVWQRLLPEEVRRFFPYRTHRKMVDYLKNPCSKLGPASEKERLGLLLTTLGQAVEDLSRKFGPEMSTWKYGHEKFHHIRLRHPLSPAMGSRWSQSYDLGPYPRGGDGSTVNNTSNSDNQDSGASFRIIVDLGNWDHSIGTNNPGQSGNPESPHYADLFFLWARGEYFPVFFSPEKVKAAAEKMIRLRPAR